MRLHFYQFHGQRSLCNRKVSANLLTNESGRVTCKLCIVKMQEQGIIKVASDTSMKELVERVEQGGHLSDAEMLRLHRGYQNVIEAVGEFGNHYRLVLTDAVLQSQALRLFLNNRGVEV
jgi:hypothetical protein